MHKDSSHYDALGLFIIPYDFLISHLKKDWRKYTIHVTPKATGYFMSEQLLIFTVTKNTTNDAIGNLVKILHL